MGKKVWLVVCGIVSVVASAFYYLIDLPIRVKEGLSGWQRWREATVDWMAEVTLYQMFGWKGWLVVTIVPGIWSAWLYRVEMQKGFSWCISRLNGRPLVAAPKITTALSHPQGQTELERCHQALVKYLAIPARSPISSEEIAGSTELYPHMEALCCVLDEQNIPHPDIDYDGLIIVDCAKWSVFLGKLWAVRHDLEQARRVYRSMI